ncbi:PREDICTED: probable cytochrome P450 304a1 [Polistes dominula]|uniref:Probable cytochrome P450 304a1 n=1 Tax=Polistes dominula TaxID=743375 RepID=A0ABM1INJ2_POLDO|nr:PREDICTED: probable cytochrome P450 304a1 [Polistes dominula]
MFYFLLLIVIFLITYEYYKYIISKPPGTPPGIVGLPIIGAYWHLLWKNYKYPHKSLNYYTKKLKSKVISCYLGSFFTVIANDYESIKEILTREEFDGRLTEAYALKARAFNQKLGIFFTDGEQWREQRRFALRHMRDFGFGRRHESFETKSREELNILMDLLKNGPMNEDEKKIYNNGLALFPDIFYQFFVNNIWEIMFGYRFERKDYEKLRYFSRNAIKFQRSGDTTGGALLIFPITCHLGNLFSFKDLMDSNYAMINFIKKYLHEYKAMYGEDDEHGFVGRYLKKLKENDLPSSFSEEYLIMTLIDFMFPNATATSSLLTFAIKFMMHFPNVAKKVRNEINDVIGSGRIPTWEDRNKLPYTEATLRETMRYETITPLSVAHRATKDTTFQGYFIPANTSMITNLDGMNNDPDFWGDPENFRPERFLKDDGQLNKDFTLPFGAGHRLCAGETYARFTVFEVFATLMQNFEFDFVDGQPTSLEDKFPGIITTPKETWIRLNPFI